MILIINNMKQYKINIESRNYDKFELVDVKTMINIDNIYNINPLKEKLFNYDIITYTNNECQLLHSTVKSSTYIPGVLVLKNNRKFGKYKQKFLYKCIPDDKRLPIFLIPYHMKNGFNKNYVNKYVIFKFKNWDNKHPYGELVNVLGNVSSLDTFYEYQLYCKSLYASIQNFTKETMKQLKTHSQEHFIELIKEKYKLENRIGRDVISIDPKTSKDFDDAFGMMENETQFIISIYITNVSMWLDVLNVWSSFTERVSTIYLPDRKRPMLPTILSDTLCSLKEDDIKFAFTLDLYINKESYTLDNYTFKNTIINIRKNYVYDTDIQEKDKLYLKIKDVLISLNNKKEYKYIDSIQTSHDLIAYLMIWMNYTSAKELVKNKCGLYRSSKMNDTFKPPSNIDDNIQKFLKIWNSYGGKYCKYIDLERHDMLELDAYVHITSPIRRLVDLLTMMKLQESLKLVEWGEEATQFYNYWTSDSSIEYINTTMRSIRRVQNDCLLLNICSTNKKILETIYKGFIFDKIKRNDGLYQYMVYLKELNMTNRITTRQDLNNYTYQDFKIYIFHDQERLKHKVRLEFQHK
jgi:exoribonuclease R